MSWKILRKASAAPAVSAAPASIRLVMSATNHALILFAQGGRDPQWAEPFEQIRDRIAKAHPEATIALAFLEIMEPSLDKVANDLATNGVKRVTLVPLFMAQGGHLKEDLPKLIAAVQDRHPTLAFKVTRAIGEVDFILDAIADWAERAFI